MVQRKHSEDFKRKVVAASFSSNESVVSVARRYGVATSGIYAWRRLYSSDLSPLLAAEPDDLGFIPVCVEANTAEDTAPEPLPSEEACHDYAVTVTCGVDRTVSISGAFALSDLVTFVRGVAL
jgi:transposase-like protein